MGQALTYYDIALIFSVTIDQAGLVYMQSETTGTYSGESHTTLPLIADISASTPVQYFRVTVNL